MNCWHCDTELVWGGDHDLDDFEESEYSIVTNLSCPRCNSYVEVYYPNRNYENEQETNSENKTSD